MASENETVEDIVCDMRSYDSGELADVWMHRFADSIEAAHRREVAELRECLKEAVDLYCLHLEKSNCMRRVSLSVSIDRWRKALEGANDEGK